jgi:hypothetical protein
MEADYELFEIAQVIDHCHLIDAESYQRTYRLRAGQRLTPGYYVVNWPEQVRLRRFNEQAEYFGPFHCIADAQAACKTMQHMWQDMVQITAKALAASHADTVSVRNRQMSPASLRLPRRAGLYRVI